MNFTVYPQISLNNFERPFLYTSKKTLLPCVQAQEISTEFYIYFQLLIWAVVIFFLLGFGYGTYQMELRSFWNNVFWWCSITYFYFNINNIIGNYIKLNNCFSREVVLRCVGGCARVPGSGLHRLEPHYPSLCYSLILHTPLYLWYV